LPKHTKSGDCKIWPSVPRGPEPRMTVVPNASSNFPETETKQTRWGRVGEDTVGEILDHVIALAHHTERRSLPVEEIALKENVMLY
jgi:hypothetical protein